MTLFFLSNSANVAELEGLVVATAKPKGSTQKPHIGKDLKPTLRKFLKTDANKQIIQMVYPEKKQSDELSGRITFKKLKNISQEKLANVLGISQGRVSQLISTKIGYYGLNPKQ
jgi:hypothetical protein